MQTLEKHIHRDAPATAKLWSPLRAPLLAFAARHPAAFVTYFLDASRLFSQRQDYFWLLHDLALDAEAAPLLDALCAAEASWAKLLAKIVADAPAAAEDCSLQAFETLHFMAAIVEARCLQMVLIAAAFGMCVYLPCIIMYDIQSRFRSERVFAINTRFSHTLCAI